MFTDQFRKIKQINRDMIFNDTTILLFVNTQFEGAGHDSNANTNRSCQGLLTYNRNVQSKETERDK